MTSASNGSTVPPIIRTLRFRVYPTRRQEAKLFRWLGLHRDLYNACLEERRTAWDPKRGRTTSIGYYDQQNQLPEMKGERPEYRELGSHALQETVRRVDRAFKAFFQRLKAGEAPGYPRFKGRSRFCSFTYPDPCGWKLLSHRRLQVTNLGTLKIRGNPKHRGEGRTCTLRYAAGRWYATIQVRLAALPEREPAPAGSRVGIDLGVIDTATLSTGERIPAPRFLKAAETKLARLQKNLARKKRKSRRRERARQRVSRLHEKIARQREDFLHQLSARLVGEHRELCLEDLQTSAMTRSARGTVEKPGRMVRQKAALNRAILEQGWSTLVQHLTYKAEEAGGTVVLVNPAGTSQRCARCDTTAPKKLSVRRHSCPACGLELHRDHNAALNILRSGTGLPWREASSLSMKREPCTRASPAPAPA